MIYDTRNINIYDFTQMLRPLVNEKYDKIWSEKHVRNQSLLIQMLNK